MTTPGWRCRANNPPGLESIQPSKLLSKRRVAPYAYSQDVGPFSAHARALRDGLRRRPRRVQEGLHHLDGEPQVRRGAQVAQGRQRRSRVSLAPKLVPRRVTALAWTSADAELFPRFQPDPQRQARAAVVHQGWQQQDPAGGHYPLP